MNRRPYGNIMSISFFFTANIFPFRKLFFFLSQYDRNTKMMHKQDSVYQMGVCLFIIGSNRFERGFMKCLTGGIQAVKIAELF